MESYLGMDFGTTGLKATGVDSDGRILSTARIPCSTVSPRAGWYEVDAEEMWRRGLVRALASMPPDVVRGARALCVSSVCASFVPVDEALRPLYNAILYGIDTRATEQVDRFNAGLHRDLLSKVAGKGFTSHSVLPKLVWLREHRPEVYAGARYFLESSNFVTSFLTGAVAWDAPSAAGGHMVDPRLAEYPPDLFDAMGLDMRKLPGLANPLEILGEVTGEASEATGLPAGIPVLVGACDVNAEAFASASVDPGSLTIVYGSSLSTLFVLSDYQSLPGFLTGPSVLPGTYRVGGATSSGGRYLDWIKSLLSLSATPEVPRPSFPGSVMMIPYLDGARTPEHAPGARILWHGMDSSTNPGELWKAAMESMGYELLSILARLSRAAPLPETVHAMGGLVSNRDFIQIMADITGLAYHIQPGVDASFGDALMALSSQRGLGEVRAIWKRSEAEGEGRIVIPDSETHARYVAKVDEYESLRELVLKLAR